jgi:hypothetical protein
MLNEASVPGHLEELIRQGICREIVIGVGGQRPNRMWGVSRRRPSGNEAFQHADLCFVSDKGLIVGLNIIDEHN